MGKILFFLSVVFSLVLTLFGIDYFSQKRPVPQENLITTIYVSPSPTPSAFVLKTPPSQKTLVNDYHIFQTFNNCGPAALSMTLSYYGIQRSQEELGRELRPYQNPQGDNDDKSVTLEELAQKAEEYGLVPFHRPNGNIELIKYFIVYDIPVIARTWTKPNEDIGHYRVVKGYDQTTGEVIQDDSLQNKNLRFSYQEFNLLWQKFNFEYLVFVPRDKVEIAKAILQNDVDEKKAWKKAVKKAEQELATNPTDVYSRFNLAVAFYNVGDYQRSIEEFERVENALPFRTLWYQIEPILAYKEVGNYNRVLEITDRVLNNGNRAFSELYQIRGEVYLAQGGKDEARLEFEKALFYNQTKEGLAELLNSI